MKQINDFLFKSRSSQNICNSGHTCLHSPGRGLSFSQQGQRITWLTKKRKKCPLLKWQWGKIPVRLFNCFFSCNNPYKLSSQIPIFKTETKKLLSLIRNMIFRWKKMFCHNLCIFLLKWTLPGLYQTFCLVKSLKFKKTCHHHFFDIEANL